MRVSRSCQFSFGTASGEIKYYQADLTDQSRGPVSIAEDKSTIRIQVMANDHFREGIETIYRFPISKKRWLPMKVDQSTPICVQEGRIIFQTLGIIAMFWIVYFNKTGDLGDGMSWGE